MLAFYLSLTGSEEEKSLIEELYNNYEQAMQRIAYSILHNKFDAEDAVHNSFLRIIGNLSKIQMIPADKRKNYIVIIVRNTSIDMLRKKKALNEVDIDNFADTPSDDISLEEYIADKDIYERTKSILYELNDTDSEILYLNLILEYSIPEIANVLGIDRHAASQRLYTAKKHLIKRLEGR